MLIVSICVNDPENGNFDGHVAGIAIHGFEECDITLEPRVFPFPCFRWLDDPPKPHDAYETAGFKIARFKFRCALYKSWYGNWSWDAVKMSGTEVLRLCKVLRNSGSWSCSEADVDFAEAWDQGHIAITRELLTHALRFDSAFLAQNKFS